MLGKNAESVLADLHGDAPARAYLLLKQLGRSRFAEVYLAIDRVLVRTVVLKIHLEGHGIAEARAIAHARHANVIEVFEVGEHEGQTFTVLEWCEGADLATWSQGRPWWEIIDRLLEAGEGLAHCHALGIVHGDVKPANILVKEGRAVLADFGLSGAPGFCLDEIGGTRGFMAPEVGEGRRDPSNDVYSLACTAWVCLCGELPFPGATVFEIWDQVFAGRPKQPKQTALGLPGEVLDAVATGLRPLEMQRPSLREWLEAVASASAPPEKRWLRPTVNIAAGLLAGLVLGLSGQQVAGLCVAEVAKEPMDAVESVEPPSMELALELARGGKSMAAWQVYAAVRATEVRDFPRTLELSQAMFDAAKQIEDVVERRDALERARWVAQDVLASAKSTRSLRGEARVLMRSIDEALTPDSQPFHLP